jgi:glutamate dehydrogenase (NAD(P)+)
MSAITAFAFKQEVNPWEAQAARFYFAAEKLKLDPGLGKILRHSTREMIVHIPVAIDDSFIEDFTDFSVQLSITRAPARGSIRCAPGVSLDGVRALASRMPPHGLHFCHQPGRFSIGQRGIYV